MRIERLSAVWADRYEAFVRSHPEGLLYQSWAYQRLLEDLLGCEQEGLIAVDPSDRIRAALPLMAREGSYGRVLNSLPYYGSHGGLIGDDAGARQHLLAALQARIEDTGTAALTVVANPLAPEGVEGIAHDLVDHRIGQWTPLPGDGDVEAALMSSFHFKTRNMVRKAHKLGIRVSIDNDALPFLHEVHSENMAEIGGLAKARRFFDLLPVHFRAGTDYRVYVAHAGEERVAGLLVFLYNQTIEYFTPVVRKDFRESQALSAVIYQAMCDGARSGFRWWNWGGTWLTQDGVYRFKSRWGTRDMPYRYLTRVRNTAILKATRAELLAGYPSFFTVPFSALAT